MKFTDIFINKPVLASVVSLFILLLGLRSAVELNVRQYPQLQNAVITINTVYVGADADLIQGFVTTPLEQEIGTGSTAARSPHFAAFAPRAPHTHHRAGFATRHVRRTRAAAARIGVERRVKVTAVSSVTREWQNHER